MTIQQLVDARLTREADEERIAIAEKETRAHDSSPSNAKRAEPLGNENGHPNNAEASGNQLNRRRFKSKEASHTDVDVPATTTESEETSSSDSETLEPPPRTLDPAEALDPAEGEDDDFVWVGRGSRKV